MNAALCTALRNELCFKYGSRCLIGNEPLAIQKIDHKSVIAKAAVETATSKLYGMLNT